MLVAVLRVMFGFLVACLVAALVQVVFAYAPEAQRPDPAGALDLVALTATQFAVFSAPFALVVAAVAEWQSIRGLPLYALAGIAIAMAGFTVQLAGESGQASILNNYAFTAFLTPGFLAGVVYWLVAGRRAGEEPPTETGLGPGPLPPPPKS